MNDTVELIQSLIGNSTDYAKQRVDLLKLKSVDKTSDLASSIISFIPLVLIFALVFFFLNIGLALLVGDLLGKAYLGFLILTAVYLITGFVLFKQRDKWVKVPIANMLIRKFLKTTKV